MRFAGGFLLGSFLSGVALMAIWPYRVVVRASGSVRPGGETSLVHAPRDGRVGEIRIQPNQVVEQGQVIAVLDPADLEGQQLRLQQDQAALESQLTAQLQEDRAVLAAAKLEVDKARATLALATSESQRYSQLMESGAASREQMEEKAASLSVARSNLAKSLREVEQQRHRGESAEARLAQQLAQNRAEQAQLARDLGRTLVRAPVGGVVFTVALRNPLQVVVAGQELARIAPKGSELLVKVLVSSEDIANVKAGQRADLRLAGCPFPDFGTLRAEVLSVAPDAFVSAGVADPGGMPAPSGSGNVGVGASGYEVTLRPESRELRSRSRSCALRLGMDLTADITTRVETVHQFLLRRTRLILGF
ncbi:secretion protein HlyD [Cyanobium sp. PCC 7001]|uniref:HlyD family secretion protein n=1 Tax=Cyanobium sp. PCC 7001 TaxID=180281 RepID=UPI0001805C0C|nr:HlyD family efflux transporter periplasmic adaptor subunit [Cyanobium sp. PCC 7001]EDY37257.1 secretion protein HlyD [Cyanobium sp. PCC 7001]